MTLFLLSIKLKLLRLSPAPEMELRRASLPTSELRRWALSAASKLFRRCATEAWALLRLMIARENDGSQHQTQ
jgi:hypothetical protein